MIDDAFKRNLFMYYVHYLYGVAVIVIVADFVILAPRDTQTGDKEVVACTVASGLGQLQANSSGLNK